MKNIKAVASTDEKTVGQHAFLQQIIERVPGMVAVYNLQSGEYIYVNNAVKDLLGYTPDEFINGGIDYVRSLIHPDDLPGLLADNKKALVIANRKNQSPEDMTPIVTVEYRMRHKNGRWRWMHTDAVVFNRDDRGKVFHVMNISIDITNRRERELREANARKQFEQKLLQSERRYRSIIENSYEAVTIADKNGVITYATPSILKILGYTPEEIIGRKIIDLFPPEYKAEVIENILEKAVAAGKTVKVKNKYLHKNGEILFVESTISNQLHDPFVNGYVTNFRDITRQKYAEEKQQYLAAIVESSDDAIISKTLKGIITSWNKSAQKIYGYTAKEAIGKHISLIIPPELLSEEDTIIATLKQGKRIKHFETVRVAKNGRKVNVSLSISPIFDETGTIIGASKIARDITQQKKYEEAIMQSRERLQLAIDAGKIGIWDWDIVHDDIIWSDRVYAIHGIPKGTKIGQLASYRSHHHPDDARRVKQAVADALAGKKPYQEEFRILTPNGKIKWVEARAIVIRDPHGKPIRMLGATIDITHRKTLEQQKDEFIGIASHELKTPITSIKAYTQLLEQKFRKEGYENASVMLTRVNTQLDKLTSLISDLLNVTKIEAGKIEFHETYFDFNELVQEIVDDIRPTSIKHTLLVTFAQTKTVYADRDRIGQVLTNLLTNAMKYSPQADEIRIKTKTDADSVTVSVKDFGIGIPKEMIPKVFDRFYRVKTPKGETYPGMGLGLYISNQIIQRQNGKFYVKSIVGKGSTFSFSLPIAKKTHPQQEVQKSTTPISPGKHPQQSNLHIAKADTAIIEA